MTLRLIISTTLLLNFSVCSAQLQPMDDGDLEQVTGQFGIVLDGIKMVADPSANLHLSFDTDIAADGGVIDNASIVGSGGCDSWTAGAVTLAGCNGISIGTFANPATFDVVSLADPTGQNPALTSAIVLGLPGSATGPSNAGSGGAFNFDYSGWGSGVDLNFRLVVYGQGFDKNGNGVDTGTPGDGLEAGEENLIFADAAWVQVKNLRLPGTELMVWSNNTDVQTGAQTGPGTFVDGGADLGVSFATKVNLSIGELNIDLANSRAYDSLNESYEAFAPNSTGDGPRSGSGFTGSDGSVQGLIKLTDIEVTNLSLGVFPYMPLHFGSIDNGAGNKPGFFVEMPMLSSNPTVYNEFYTNVAKADISIGGFQLGRFGTGTTSVVSAGELGNPVANGGSYIPTQTGYSIGSAAITGLRVQHLRIELGS